MTTDDEARAWFRHRAGGVIGVEGEIATSGAAKAHAATIVRAALARDIPAGRDLTADDVREAWRDVPSYSDHRDVFQHIAEHLNRIARGAPERGDDESSVCDRMGHKSRDVYEDGELSHSVCDECGAEMLPDLDDEPQADAPPFAVGDRVRGVKSGRLGAVKGDLEQGHHRVLFDDGEKATVAARFLEPAPQPQEPPRSEPQDPPRFEREVESIAIALWQLWGDVSPGCVTSPGPIDQRFGDLVKRVRALTAAGAVRAEEES